MTSITMSKRHRQPVTDDDMSRQSNVFTLGSMPDMERPTRKPLMTLHLPHRQKGALQGEPARAQRSLLEGEADL